MTQPGRFSVAAAYRDLRGFLASREPYEFVFLVLAMAITGFLVFVFVHDSHVEPPYVPHIIYVQSWRADRTDAEIKAQQQVDEVARLKKQAEVDAEKARDRAAFQRLDSAMSNMGF